jgi:ATP-dependent DNA helicase RecQ
VPLDTPEQRQFALEKAGARLGISSLYPEQHEVLEASLRGEDVLMVLPTGFGKSACYQIPSMILPKPVLVISPLLALMRDQYEKLQRRAVPCVKLDGTVRGKARKEALAQIAKGERVLVMTTPETLGAPDAMAALAEGGISLAAVDEAHCISEWGYDFRPAYLQIGERLKLLGGPPVLALTATATEKVRLAIMRFVGMREPRIIATSPHRSNLAFDVLHCSSGARLRALVRLALRVRRPPRSPGPVRRRP